MQEVPTVKGGTYRLTFAVGNIFDDRDPPFKVYGEVSTVKLLIDDELVFTAVNGNWHTSQLGWKTFKVSFIAKSSTTKLTFMNADPWDDNSNGLDSVVVTRVSR